MEERILDTLRRSSRPLTALELARTVGMQTRKEINPTLYALEKHGKIRKIGNVPATWFLSSSLEQQHVQQNAVASPSAVHPTSVGGGVEGQVVAFLSRVGKTCSALEVAKALGFKTRKDVNPHLYEMEKSGLITRVDSQGAPQWKISCTSSPNRSSAAVLVPSAGLMQISAVDLTHIPVENVKERLLTVLNANPTKSYTGLELSKLSKCGIGRQEITSHLQQLQHDGKVKASLSIPVQWSSVNSSFSTTTTTSTIDQRTCTMMETESNLEDQVLTALRTKTGVGQTALELAKCIGMNITRQDIQLCMENLQSRGVVRCLGTQPEQWLIIDVTTTQLSEDMTTAASSISDLTMNPVSALTEYCQSNKLDLSFPIIEEHGPPHRKTFVIAAKFGNNQFKAESYNKKEAKRMAADLALQSIRVINTKLPTVVGTPPTSFCDKIYMLSHSKFLQVQQEIQHPQPGRKVIAAFIMEDTETNYMQVVSIGSGTQCVKGHNICSKGLVVNDSHAEVVARRSLMCFFYKELLAKLANTNTVFIDDDIVGLVKIRDTLKFHLYISTAPCGDGGLFSRGDDENRVPPPDNSHKPTLHNKKQGILRTKIEGGEGTIPVEENARQTWDGILQGRRLLTMSCSDKILRWNILGLQGALLSQFMKPVYMSSLTLGSLHHHGHLSRAVCCRAKGIEGSLPDGFMLNHPTLGRAHDGDTMERHTEKTSNFSLNWALGDEKAELTDGETGRLVAQSTCHSRISKASLFSSYATICTSTKHSSVTIYSDVKKASLGYQEAKLTFFELFQKKGYGNWLKKPSDLEQFTVNTSS